MRCAVVLVYLMRLERRTRPSPPQLPQLCEICPAPLHCGHVLTCWKLPSGVRAVVITCRRPRRAATRECGACDTWAMHFRVQHSAHLSGFGKTVPVCAAAMGYLFQFSPSWYGLKPHTKTAKANQLDHFTVCCDVESSLRISQTETFRHSFFRNQHGTPKGGPKFRKMVDNKEDNHPKGAAPPLPLPRPTARTARVGSLPPSDSLPLTLPLSLVPLGEGRAGRPTCPAPPHALHTLGSVPAFTPEPEHVSHPSRRMVSSSFSVPNTASRNERLRSYRSSSPCQAFNQKESV
jgi:hypothetical protein